MEAASTVVVKQRAQGTCVLVSGKIPQVSIPTTQIRGQHCLLEVRIRVVIHFSRRERSSCPQNTSHDSSSIANEDSHARDLRTESRAGAIIALNISRTLQIGS